VLRVFSLVTTSSTEIIFSVTETISKLFQRTLNVLENIHQLQQTRCWNSVCVTRSLCHC